MALQALQELDVLQNTINKQLISFKKSLDAEITKQVGFQLRDLKLSGHLQGNDGGGDYQKTLELMLDLEKRMEDKNE